MTEKLNKTMSIKICFVLISHYFDKHGRYEYSKQLRQHFQSYYLC